MLIIVIIRSGTVGILKYSKISHLLQDLRNICCFFFWFKKNELVLKNILTSVESSSLCFSQVWQIRLDMHLLNHDGNITDAASIAGIVALCHFRRPDVSVQGEEVTVVSLGVLKKISLNFFVVLKSKEFHK